MEQLLKYLEMLRQRDPLPALSPTEIWNQDISRWLDGVSLEQLLGSSSIKREYGELLRAVLYLWNDDLDKAHRIAQSHNSSTSQYIHGVMHRREPDYGNSAYWFRRVGDHPNFSLLKKEFPEWEPLDFLDWCEEAEGGGSSRDLSWLLRVQLRELELLFEFVREHSLTYIL